MNRLVVYTAIFGKKDDLLEPKIVPEQCDFICFTDQPFTSRVWQVRTVAPPVPGDPTRSNRYYKILAHKVLPEYNTSIYVDGNVEIVGNLSELVQEYLRDTDLAVLDHRRWKAVPLSSMREGLTRLLEMEQEGKHQEDAQLMQQQADAYFDDGFPDTGGLAWNMVVLRRHNTPAVIEAMEAWWQELMRWSKRDQMSFNYIMWKTGLPFTYIPIDGSDSAYTRRRNHYLPPHRKAYSYLLGFLKRLRKVISL